jgi:hypothetical protein
VDRVTADRRDRQACEGPVIHPKDSVLEASVYFRDGSGNFIELCAPRNR